jgi:hypothetical protein
MLPAPLQQVGHCLLPAGFCRGGTLSLTLNLEGEGSQAAFLGNIHVELPFKRAGAEDIDNTL